MIIITTCLGIIGFVVLIWIPFFVVWLMFKLGKARSRGRYE